MSPPFRSGRSPPPCKGALTWNTRARFNANLRNIENINADTLNSKVSRLRRERADSVRYTGLSECDANRAESLRRGRSYAWSRRERRLNAIAIALCGFFEGRGSKVALRVQTRTNGVIPTATAGE